MPTAFENFVNVELPRRIFSDIPPTGNLPAGKMLVTTGVGLGVTTQDVPSGGGTVTEPLLARYTVTSSFQKGEVLDITTGQGVSGGQTSVTGDTLTSIGADETTFLNDSLIRIRWNGVQLIKGVEVFWVSSTELYIDSILDVDDVIEIETP